MGVCRGIRGAITAEANTKAAILRATKRLLQQLVTANELRPEDLAAAMFTTTRDLNAEFPAVAARQMGWDHVALLCSHEMDVPDALASCIRVLLLVNTEKAPEELVYVYLDGARSLRDRGTEGREG
ncbi:MAG: chorismate mutase [Chloroflexi bacterium]|nr:chorismate mutase [Chloroflexota bacterium]